MVSLKFINIYTLLM